MDNSAKKKSLRDLFLEKRDNTSFDYMQIASKKIHQKIKRIKKFKEAEKIGIYYPNSSEVLTQDIIQELLSIGKKVFVPKVVGKKMEFREIVNFSSLEKGNFEIMEPKDNCPKENNLDLILVPSVGITTTGVRLGYGYGFYDKFLAEYNTDTISLVLEKQIIKNIPKEDHDVSIDWVVTEDRIINTRE